MKSTKCLATRLRQACKYCKYITSLRLLLILLPIIVRSQIAVDFNHFTQLYNEGKYQQLYDEAKAIRNMPYGKIWKIDYFISKALCASGYSSEAKQAFNYTLSAYKGNLDTKQFNFLMKERDACLTSLSPAEIPSTVLSNLISLNTFANVSGKMGYVVNCNSEAGAFDADTSFHSEDLENRLFPLEDTVKAVAYYTKLLGSGYKVRVGGRYVFIIPASSSFANLSNVTRMLEDAYNFYSENFHLRKPDKIIAVYLMGNEENLRTIAKKVHGMNLPNRNIGYSCLADLSLLGTSSPYTIGTIYHELFHLMVRTDVGDIPGWLDEGTACLFETSSWENGVLKGQVSQWRTEIFKGLMIPRLTSLIENNWDEFSVSPELNACDVALNYALSKHFAIYLQQNGWLPDVITAFKERKNVLEDTASQNESDFEVLERALHKSMPEIQSEFDAWMQSTFNLHTTRTDSEADILITNAHFTGDRSGFENRKQMLLGDLTKVAGTGPLPNWFIDKLNSFLLDAKFSFNQ
jgi:hypothetical protein